MSLALLPEQIVLSPSHLHQYRHIIEQADAFINAIRIPL